MLKEFGLLPVKVHFLKQILPAYQILRQLRIYHSNTKLENIVYSEEKGGYIIIDFGIANIIGDNDENEVRMSDYIEGGSKSYNSPEKKFYLKTCKL